MRATPLLFLLCACATAAPAVVDSCALAYDHCNNQCFKPPNYRHNGPQCVEGPNGQQLCPQENQLIDTIAAGKCFEQCEWDAKLCRK